MNFGLQPSQDQDEDQGPRPVTAYKVFVGAQMRKMQEEKRNGLNITGGDAMRQVGARWRALRLRVADNDASATTELAGYQALAEKRTVERNAERMKAKGLGELVGNQMALD